MYSFFCVSPILSLYLILARARPENLFLLDSLHNSLDAPSDDVSFLWNPDETTLDSTGLASNPLDQDIDLMGDVDSVGNSNDPFTSNIMGLTALPSCKSEGSQTDGVLKARDGESCRPKETVDLPTEIFQDPEAYLRGNLDTPKGQNNQHGQGDQKDENMNSGFLTPDFKEDEKICPSEIFGPSNIPVCRNTLTGVMDSEVASNAVTLFNAIPCRCCVTHFVPFVELLAIVDHLARRYPGMP